MEELKIKLVYRRQDFIEIYYPDNSKSIFTWKGTNRWIYIAGLSAVLSAVTYILANKYDDWIVAFVMCLVFLITSVISLLFAIYKYYQWKRPIEAYLDKLGKYESQLLILTDRAIEMRNDDETHIEKWENMNKASIKSNYISMIGIHQNYIFSQKSMEPGEYEKLKEFIVSSMKS